MRNESLALYFVWQGIRLTDWWWQHPKQTFYRGVFKGDLKVQYLADAEQVFFDSQEKKNQV